MKPLEDIDWAKKMLGMSESWIRKKTMSDELPVVRIGRRVLFRPDDIERYIESHSVQTAQNRTASGGAEEGDDNAQTVSVRDGGE